MTQITVPWLEKAPETYSRFRRKAIVRLLAGGVLHILVAIGCYSGLGIGRESQIADWRIAAAWLLVVAPALIGALLTAGGLAVTAYRTIRRVLRAPFVAAAIFFGSVAGICLVVWAHSLLFDLVKDMAATNAAQGDSEVTLVPLVGAADLTARDIYDYIEERGCPWPVAAYLIWPLQFALVRDLIAIGGIIGFISIIPAFGIWWERKIAGRIQSRLGPMRTGGWHGWSQSAADGIKLLFKEDTIPPEGDQLLFRLAPYLTFVPPILAFIALPFAATYVFRNLDVALLFILAMLGIEVVGVILAGWASNNKWSVYGAMREACQMVSYEIPMGMSLLIPVMTAGTLQLTEIADQQSGGFHSWFVFANPWCFIAFFSYYTASLASCKRAPFDLPESESELVAGFHTEYSGFRWSLFFFGEYVAMFVVAGLAAILFLGGWKSPFPADWAPAGDGLFPRLVRGLFFDGPILFVLKAAFLYYVQLWIRWTLPRIRIDQVLYACVQVLLPLTMAVLLANTIWMLGLRHGRWEWLVTIDRILHVVLVGVGYALVAAIVGLAAHGFVNRRRLPGLLVVDHLPGS